MEILIDPKTQAMLKELYRTMQELNGRAECILAVIANISNSKGVYQITPDFSKITFKEEEEEKNDSF